MLRWGPRLCQVMRGNKLVLLVLLLFFIVIALLMKRSGETRGLTQTTGSQKSASQSSAGGKAVVQSEKNKQRGGNEEQSIVSEEDNGQSDENDDISIETDEDSYEEDDENSGGFFGFLKSATNSEWLNPFQSTRLRDPPPASWESGFGEEISGKDEDDEGDNGEEGYDSTQDNEEETKVVVKQRPEMQRLSKPMRQPEKPMKQPEKPMKQPKKPLKQPEKPMKQPAQTKAGVKKTTPTENSKPLVKPKVRPAAKQAAKPAERNEVAPKLVQIPARDLIETFNDKLSKISGKPKKLGDTCFNKNTLANSCDDGKCQQMKLPSDPEERVNQLIQHPGLRLSPPQHALLQEMASKVRKTYDVILLTTASSNHFLESQALLQNLHKNVFPVLKNFTLLFYDIGLTSQERTQMERYCQCQVLSFPFDKLPKYLLNLKCYAWKPLMIKAHIRQANVVLWLDASIRFNGNPSQLQELIHRVKDRGVQIGSSSSDTSFRSFRSLYHYFGDEPCMYLGMGQAKATIGGYHNEPFVERVILEPWVACGLHQECMCPRNNLSAGCAESKKMAENYARNNGPITYGLCHRFDQSVITLILHKLYRENYPWVMMNVHEYGDIHRDHQVEYFKGLKN